MENRCKTIVDNKLKKKATYNEIKAAIISELSTYTDEKVGRSPTILPVIMEVKKSNLQNS